MQRLYYDLSGGGIPLKGERLLKKKKRLFYELKIIEIHFSIWLLHTSENATIKCVAVCTKVCAATESAARHSEYRIHPIQSHPKRKRRGVKWQKIRANLPRSARHWGGGCSCCPRGGDNGCAGGIQLRSDDDVNARSRSDLHRRTNANAGREWFTALEDGRATKTRSNHGYLFIVILLTVV